MTIECGYDRDGFWEIYNPKESIIENKCLNDMLLATFGLLDDFNKLNNKQVEQSKELE